ncbi:hypothetical protein AX15_005387 [Amanita polypyramis BW_CC]|nr:hypothetical protein AX15_005387 [Amanita polypyramis BW_CC]
MRQKIDGKNREVFWSFPSRQGTMVQAELLTVNDTRKIYELQLSELKEAMEVERPARIDNDQRTALLERLTSLKREFHDLEEELAAYGDCDPATFERTKRAALLAKEAAIRWTDNYATLLGYFTRQKGVDVLEVRRYLEIEEDYEDIC